MVNLDGLLESMADLIADKVAKKLADSGSTPVQSRDLTVDQAATFLGRTKDAIQHMVSAGKIAIVKSDRRVFLDVVQGWERRGQRNTEPNDEVPKSRFGGRRFHQMCFPTNREEPDRSRQPRLPD